MECIVRPETPADHARVHDINTRAFETDSEAVLVDSLRREAQPLISLVADCGDVVVGHILFTPVAIGDAKASARTMGLAPLTVDPDYQDRGIGSLLVNVGLEACATAGCEVVVTLGHPDYYGRFGFGPAVENGIGYVDREYDPFFMVKELVEGALEKYQGEVKYHRLIEEH
jgi:putative acetyltransferase